MSTAVMPESRSVTALAKVEARRYARHPVFLVGLALWVLTSVISVNHELEDLYGQGVIPAFFLGVFGMVVGYRHTRSMERSAEAVETVPVPVTTRVAALLVAAAVPAVLGLVSGLLMVFVSDVKADWVYGTWGAGDRVAILLGQSVVTAAGGALLGIAAARWLRFPGAVVVAPVVVVTWVVVTNGWAASNQNATSWLIGRMLSPFAFFTTIDTDHPRHAIESWRGDPWFFLLWLVLLCVFAAVVALLKGAEGETRATLKRALAVVVVLALASCALAVLTGPDHATRRDVTGVSRI
jgi:hypothetical protein